MCVKKIYCLSGIGADERAFKKMALETFCNPVYLKWEQPKKEETISEYASRLIPQIIDQHPIIVGISFGGMVGIEIAKQIPVKKVILISSAKTGKDIKKFTRFLGFLGILNGNMAKYALTPNRITFRLFGVKSNSERTTIKPIIEETNHDFFNWAYRQIGTWKNNDYPTNIVLINGTKDKIMPFRKKSTDYPIIGGGHLMIVNRADEIADILKKEID